MRKRISSTAVLAVAIGAAGVLLSACIASTSGIARSEPVSAIALPPADTGAYQVSVRNHSAFIEGYTWACMVDSCHSSLPTVASLRLGKHALAQMALYWQSGLHFRFYVSNLPSAGAALTIRLNTGARTTLRVAPGDHLNVTVASVL